MKFFFFFEAIISYFSHPKKYAQLKLLDKRKVQNVLYSMTYVTCYVIFYSLQLKAAFVYDNKDNI